MVPRSFQEHSDGGVVELGSNGRAVVDNSVGTVGSWMERHIGRRGGLKGGGLGGIGRDFGGVSSGASGCANCRRMGCLGRGCGLNIILDVIGGGNKVATGQQLCEKFNRDMI